MPCHERDANDREAALLQRLVRVIASSHPALLSQLDGMKVSMLDEHGSLRLFPSKGNTPVWLASLLPVEAYFEMPGGIGVSVLLHIRNGYLYELELVPDRPEVSVIIPEITHVSILERP